MNLSRRLFLTGLIAAPVIVRPGILMPVKPVTMTATEAAYRMEQFKAEFMAGFDRMRDRLINPPLFLHPSEVAYFARYDALPTHWRQIETIHVQNSTQSPIDSVL